MLFFSRNCDKRLSRSGVSLCERRVFEQSK